MRQALPAAGVSGNGRLGGAAVRLSARERGVRKILMGFSAMKKFDTKIQYLKYQSLREVAREAWNDRLLEHVLDIPERIVPGKTPTMRCCVYKERAILGERVKLAMGGDRDNPNVIEVIDIACDECPISGCEVTNACRGCLAHHCAEACRFGAISFDANQHAVVDKNKCRECGACTKVCPYSAIIMNKRPCERACKVGAISMSETSSASIDNDRCIACGACVYQCPFGAISDKSYILEVIDLIKRKYNGYRLYAVVAPSVSSQFSYAKLGQVISGIKRLGFDEVVEAALGADMVARAESAELAEKGFLTSSCCPAFVSYVEKAFPDLKEHVSHNISPMATIAKHIKETSRDCRIVFIGPCTAKKAEFKRPEVGRYIDSVLTFEELQALFDSRDIEITELEEETLDNASYFGRIFARSGGLSDAVAQGLKEQGLDAGFELKAVPCDGIEQCRTALLKASKGMLDGNFIEGMACVGGCIGGAGCLTHGPKDRSEIDSYGREAAVQTISEAVGRLEKTKKERV